VSGCQLLHWQQHSQCGLQQCILHALTRPPSADIADICRHCHNHPWPSTQPCPGTQWYAFEVLGISGPGKDRINQCHVLQWRQSGCDVGPQPAAAACILRGTEMLLCVAQALASPRSSALCVWALAAPQRCRAWGRMPTGMAMPTQCHSRLCDTVQLIIIPYPQQILTISRLPWCFAAAWPCRQPG
jgi:hypothetical protein